MKNKTINININIIKSIAIVGLASIALVSIVYKFRKQVRSLKFFEKFQKQS